MGNYDIIFDKETFAHGEHSQLFEAFIKADRFNAFNSDLIKQIKMDLLYSINMVTLAYGLDASVADLPAACKVQVLEIFDMIRFAKSDQADISDV